MFEPKNIKLIAFDADDTLWHNETLFTLTQGKFKQLLLKYHSEEWIDKTLYETELKNLEYFGYGVKGFTLSMIETAIELSEGRIGGNEIRQIINYSKEMLASPIELLEGVEETIVNLSENYELMVITKGDLFDQESKIARSGIGEYFSHIEIVPRKTPEIYERILHKQKIQPEDFMMVGNSLKSDVFPVAAIGATGVHIPYETTWAHELAEADEIEKYNFINLENIGKLLDLLD